MVLVYGNVKMNSYVNFVYHLIMLREKCLVLEDLNLLRAYYEVFFMLPLDLYIDRMRLLLLYDCLNSERSVVRMCAEVSTDVEVVR